MFLESPIDNSPLVAFRVLFASVLAIFLAVRFRENLRYFTRGKIHIGFELTRFLRPLPRRGMAALLALEIVLALAFAAGVPASAALLCATRTYVFLLDASRYNNHDYLVCLLIFLYAVIGADHHQSVPRWELLIVQLQIVLVYFFGGIAKLNRDWLVRAMPFAKSLREFQPAPGPPWWRTRVVPNARIGAALQTLARRPATAFFFAWSGAIFDLSIGFFLLDPRTQLYALIPFFAFHLFNHWFYGLHIFPYVNYASAALFLPERFYTHLWPPTHASAEPTSLVFFFTYLAIQLLVPLRRSFYAYVLTRRRVYIHADQHQHFAWTMKLVDQEISVFRVEVFDRASGHTVNPIALRRLLGDRGAKHVLANPRALMMLCERLKPLLDRDDAQQRHGLRAQVQLSCNGRPPVELIDPSTDLRLQQVRIFTAYPWHNLSDA